MIRIEDQEDVAAFKEAKAEIDDEFDEIEGRAAATPQSKDQTVTTRQEATESEYIVEEP